MKSDILEYRSRALKSRSKLRAAFGKFLLHQNSSLFGENLLTLSKSRGRYLYFLLYYVSIVNFAETPECGEPEKPIYGIVKVHGEVAHYNCIPGYIRRGNSTRTCTWSGWKPVPVPECIGNYLIFFLSKIAHSVN